MSRALEDAVKAATAKVGAAMVSALANCFGSTNGEVSDVPANRRAGLTAALTKLAIGEGSIAMGNAAARGDAKAMRAAAGLDDDAFADIRSHAFGEKPEATQRPKPAQRLDASAIYEKWNASTRDGNREDD